MQTLVDVLAFSVNTDVSFAAVKVLITFRDRDELTAYERISSVTWKTVADRFVVSCMTFRVRSTHSTDKARVLAESVDARLIKRALTVASTSWNTPRRMAYLSVTTFFITTTEAVRHFLTGNSRISRESGVARTKLAMLDCSTERVSPTYAGPKARILTLAVQALLINGTVSVGPASNDAFVEFANPAEMTFRIVDALRRWWKHFHAVVFRIASIVR